MATLDYTRRLQNLESRRFDPILNETITSRLFASKDIPEDVKYLVESMKPIEKKYNEKTLEAAENVKTHLERGLNVHFKRAYRKQGSVQTATNIKVHSDIDLLTIIDRYFYPEKSNGNNYTESDPNVDIKELRKQSTAILKNIYDDVDDSGEKCISIYNKNLRRDVDIVFGFWYNSIKYEETQNEYYRGVYLYKFPNGPRKLDYPFAHINQVNAKGDATNDGSRRGIRLLKTLRADCEIELNELKSFQLTTVVHSIQNINLIYSLGSELDIAKAISKELNTLIQDPIYRKSVKCPKGIEKPLEEDKIVPNLKKLKIDLDVLIEDATKDILGSPLVRRAILNS